MKRRCAGPLLAAASALYGHAVQAQVRTPSISCQVADSNIVLDLLLPITPEGGPAKSGLRGSMEIHHFKVPKDRRRWSLDGRQPTQMWHVGNDLRLRLVLASGDDLVDLVIETQRRPDAGANIGTFRLETAEGVKVQGRIECHAG